MMTWCFGYTWSYHSTGHWVAFCQDKNYVHTGWLQTVPTFWWWHFGPVELSCSQAGVYQVLVPSGGGGCLISYYHWGCLWWPDIFGVSAFLTCFAQCADYIISSILKWCWTMNGPGFLSSYTFYFLFFLMIFFSYICTFLLNGPRSPTRNFLLRQSPSLASITVFSDLRGNLLLILNDTSFYVSPLPSLSQLLPC